MDLQNTTFEINKMNSNNIFKNNCQHWIFQKSFTLHFDHVIPCETAASGMEWNGLGCLWCGGVQVSVRFGYRLMYLSYVRSSFKLRRCTFFHRTFQSIDCGCLLINHQLFRESIYDHPNCWLWVTLWSHCFLEML